MLGVDEAKQIAWSRAAAKEQAVAQRHAGLLREIDSNTRSVEDDNGRPTDDALAQMGKPLTGQELIRRLKLCNPRLIFERSIRFSHLYGIYVEQWERTAAGTFDKKKTHVCGMEAGIMPEFSILHKKLTETVNPELLGGGLVDREAVKFSEVPTFSHETRGWRTVLVRLLHMNLIGRLDVEKHFGWLPSQDRAKWHQQTT